jgi:uncharacterized protein
MRFLSEDTEMVGDLFLPAHHDVSEQLPAVLVVGPWLNVKEQVATNYAKRLAQKGFAAFVFDFRHWGLSGSSPREYERPLDKIADIHNALQFLAKLPQVDPARIGVLGVCFGVGYLAATAPDQLIKSIAAVAAWVHDVPSMTALFGADEIARRRAVGKESMAAFQKNGAVSYVPAGSDTDKTAAMLSPDPNFYYNTAKRGKIPAWTNRFAVLGWEEWLDFDGVSQASSITQPLLMIHSDGAAFPDNARKFFSLARGPKQLVWTDGEHTQFYDTEPQIGHALDAVSSHFQRTLAPALQGQLSAQAALAGTQSRGLESRAGEI